MTPRLGHPRFPASRGNLGGVTRVIVDDRKGAGVRHRVDLARGSGEGMDIVVDGPALVLAGDFDVRSTMEVRAALYEHLDRTGDDVVVDLSGVRTVDHTALKVLAVATRYADRAGRHLVLRGCCPAVLRMLHLSRLIRVVELERQPHTA